MTGVASGAGLLLRGLRIVWSRPRLFALGMVPPLITSILMTGLLVLLGLNVDSLAAALTPFARNWGGVGTAVRAVVALLLFVVALLVMVLTFTAITLALGDPIYERISRRVDAELGPLPTEPDEATMHLIARVTRQSAATIGLSLAAGAGCFVLGLIPVVGAVLAPLASAFTGGRLIVREITGPAFERRGLVWMRQRTPALAGHRALTLGFGVPTFWLLSIPGVAVLVFPAAVAGATLLVRRVLGEPTGPASAPGTSHR